MNSLSVSSTTLVAPALGTFLLDSLVLICVLSTAVWIFSVALRNAGIADVWWGLGFVALVWYHARAVVGADGKLPVRALLLAALVTLWGLRLALHIAARAMVHGEEDQRYQHFRQRCPVGAQFYWLYSLFQVFLLQGSIMVVVAIPLVAAIRAKIGYEARLGLLDYVGVFVWGFGFLVESLGDYQLAAFKRDPANKGKLLTTGLWSATRHPNYFGDATMWWGLFLISLGAVPYLGLWWTAVGPLVMNLLLVYVSGVQLLEKVLRRNKSPEEFDKYAASGIPAFVPHLRPYNTALTAPLLFGAAAALAARVLAG
eukprot:gnl/Hemi2/4962_TR1718_c0_g1_i1.p1 gnl/Hemi2/4962_TR1718_c0_g1~~gnl/Hemi2/4962_TR1718_c0_g1_i1.p1  ORF type:complete len:313 (+),score=99.67 gnl/Hemi2/4962_TR1718_c0_g1_i1:66-1004(+)